MCIRDRVEAGLGDAAIYALYKPLAENDREEINGIVSATNQFYIKSGIIFVALLLGLAVLYPMFARTEKFSDVELFCLVLILGMSGILDFFTLGKYRAILSADQKIYVLSLASIVYYVINTAVIVLLSYQRISVITVRAIAMIAVFARTFILLSYCHKTYPFINNRVTPCNDALKKRWDALFLQLLGTVQRGLPVILATIYTSFMEVSVYSVYNMVMVGIMGVLDIFTSGLFASFGDILARGEQENLKRVYTDFEYIYYAVITVIYSTAFLMIIPFVRLYTRGINDVNYENFILGSLFVLNGYLYNLKTPQGMLVKSAGLYRETKIQTTVQALILAVFGIIGGAGYGLTGIMAAACVSNLYRDIDLCFFISKYVTHLSAVSTIKRIILSLVEMSLSVGIACLFLKQKGIDTGNWGDWIFGAAGVVLVSTFIAGILSWCLDRRAFVSSMKRVYSMLYIRKGTFR